jgi:HSP20 family molecular chaperone IbpA
MSQVSVRRAEGNSSAGAQSILESLNGVSDSIRNRAFQLFESHGSSSGNELNDWLQAERDLFSIPPSELSETDREYRIQVAVPGFDSKELDVIAQANTIMVRGSSSSSSSGSNGGDSSSSQVQYSDFTSKTLMRRFELSSSIDMSGVTAKLDNGMLSILATKSTSGSKSSAAKA